MQEVAIRMTEYEFTLHSAATSLSAPSGVTSGAAPSSDYLTKYPVGGTAPRYWILKIDGSTSLTLSSAKLCRYDTAMTTWRVVADINDGRDITLTSTLGYEFLYEHIGGGGRYAVQGTLSTGNVTIKLVPVASQG